MSSTEDRSSEAEEPKLVTDELQVARIEAANTIRQFDAAMHELLEWIGNSNYKIRPSTILYLNRVALDGLSSYAGIYRPADIKIIGSKHLPVSAADVPRLVEDLCDYVNVNREKSAVHLAAYVLWRLNWIHPFVDGNGRTARVLSYIILCARLGYRLPGSKTIPEQISANKQPYYKALEAADWADSAGVVDVSKLEQLIEATLAVQLLDVHNNATGAKAVLEDANSTKSRQSNIFQRSISWIENHPALIGLVGVVLAAILALLFQA